MNKLLYKSAAILGLLVSFNSCSLDEYNPGGQTGELVYGTYEGISGLINYCYTPFNGMGSDGLFNNMNYVFASETGTDLWENSYGSYNPEWVYYEGMASNNATLYKMWRIAYSCIYHCSAAIDRSEKVTDADATEVKAKVAEAHCLRAFYNFIIVEQFGGVTLVDHEEKEPNLSPKRSSVEDFYKLIISDLKTAIDGLPVVAADGNKGRVTKKFAQALLAKVYLQGSQYDFGGTEYATLAKNTAEYMIEHQSEFGAPADGFLYDDFKNVFSDANRQDNKEALMVATFGSCANSDVTALSGSHNIWYNLFLPKIGKYSDIGMLEKTYSYGRANMGVLMPTKYLMDVYKDDDARFYNSFVTAYGPAGDNTGLQLSKCEKVLTEALCDKYGINRKHKGHVFREAFSCGWVTAWAPTYKCIYKGDGTTTGVKSDYEEVETVDPMIMEKDGLIEEDANNVAIYFSKKKLTDAEKAERPYICFNIDDMYNSDGAVQVGNDMNSQDARPKVFPMHRKFFTSLGEYNNHMQKRYCDIFIMRFAEVYLIAAEANVMLNHKDVAKEQVNKLRSRAHTTLAEESDMTIDFILDERARELCGEYCRWYDLKRTGKMKERLQKYNKRAGNSFDSGKHLLRPISVDFLNQIENATEYGTNGY